MFPIRCTTCNKVLGDYVNTYEQKTTKKEMTPLQFFIKYKIRRYCCRREFLGYSKYLNQKISTQIVGSKNRIILKK